MQFSELKTNDAGLIPVVVQEDGTGEVLMLAYMNREAYERTLETGLMTYFSRSRQELWLKGETSGHYQHVVSLQIDCDNDTLLAIVRQEGAACHTGNHSCFYRTIKTF
jgi:phosphoribosyl-AMP cyclohydrolase